MSEPWMSTVLDQHSEQTVRFVNVSGTVAHVPSIRSRAHSLSTLHHASGLPMGFVPNWSEFASQHEDIRMGLPHFDESDDELSDTADSVLQSPAAGGRPSLHTSSGFGAVPVLLQGSPLARALPPASPLAAAAVAPATDPRAEDDDIDVCVEINADLLADALLGEREHAIASPAL